MLKYDSVHGRFDGTVAVENGALIVNGNKIRLTAEMDPANLKWNEVDADVVVESTGFFLTDETARKHIQAGAKKVIMSAPSKDATPMFVMVLTTILMQVRTLSLTLLVLLTAWLLSLKY